MPGRWISLVMAGGLVLILGGCGTSPAGPDRPEIALDVGHGLIDQGATSARGRAEFAFNQDFARVLAPALQARGLGVREINFAGEVGELAERPRQAAGTALFLSLHHDSIAEEYLLPWEWEGQAQTHTEVKRGFGLFISRANPRLENSLACASALGAALRAAGFPPSTWHERKHVPADRDNGVWYYDNLVVLYRTTVPAVLLEAGVIKHRDEELELLDPQRQARMARALADGIEACLGGNGAVSPAAGVEKDSPAS